MWLQAVLLVIIFGNSKEMCESTYNYEGSINCTEFKAKDKHILVQKKSPYDDKVNVFIYDTQIQILRFETVSSIQAYSLTIDAEIEEVDDRAFENTTISIIILDNNKITTLKNSCFNSTFITYLSLKNNKLTKCIPQNLAGLMNLIWLYLKNNSIVSIEPYSFKDLQSLKLLDLSYNKLEVFPREVFRTMKYLAELDLSYNLLKSFDHVYLEENSALHTLNLEGNLLTNLDLRDFPKFINTVYAGFNKISNFNASTLEKLEGLRLENNEIQSVENCLEELPQLQYLNLSNNHLGSSSVKISFKHLLNLDSLVLDHNNLSQWVQLPNNLLDRLTINDNNFKILHFNFTIQVSYLSLKNNSLTKIKNLFNVQWLDQLNLDKNSLTEINFETFRNLTNLRSLWLSHNSIRKLNEGCFRDLSELRFLDMSYNELTIVPSSAFVGLKFLETLNLAHNSIKYLNEHVFYPFIDLSNLDISFNNLTEFNVKTVIKYSPMLKFVNVDGNNWKCYELLDLLTENRKIELTSGNSFDVSNVHGIPCDDSDYKMRDGSEKNFKPEVLEVLNSTNLNTERMVNKMSLLNALWLIFIGLLIGNFVYNFIRERRSRERSGGVMREENEQHMSLI